MNRSLKILLIALGFGSTVAAGYIYYDARHSVFKFYSAAENGDAPTETSMGFYYYRGDPFPQDYAKAMKWWRRAADQGYAEAQFNVGHMYWLAEGVPRDAVQAYMWMKLAAMGGNKQAHDSLS